MNPHPFDIITFQRPVVDILGPTSVQFPLRPPRLVGQFFRPSRALPLPAPALPKEGLFPHPGLLHSPLQEKKKNRLFARRAPRAIFSSPARAAAGQPLHLKHTGRSLPRPPKGEPRVSLSAGGHRVASSERPPVGYTVAKLCPPPLTSSSGVPGPSNYLEIALPRVPLFLFLGNREFKYKGHARAAAPLSQGFSIDAAVASLATEGSAAFSTCCYLNGFRNLGF